MYKYLLWALLIVSKNGFCCDPTVWSGQNELAGVYRSGDELFYIRPDHTFALKRTAPKYQNDVVLPICYDTIAKGSWVAVKAGVLKLDNDSNFERIYFTVRQEKRLSDDSVYVKIAVPRDDAFFEGRFEYELYFLYGIGSYAISKDFFVLPRNKVSPSAAYNFSLRIKDAYPATCGAGHKCYQRIFFEVFKDFDFDHRSNYFTISLDNFNECFVERMDMSNEILLVDGGNIQWRGKVYKKIG